LNKPVPPVPPPNENWSPEVVRTDELAQILKRWIRTYELEIGYVNNTIKDIAAGVSVISDRSGLNQRVVHRVITVETVHTSVAIADKLLIAIDQHYVLMTGELQVIANPKMSQERWMDIMKERGCIYDT
jgi:hypothetical protein